MTTNPESSAQPVAAAPELDGPPANVAELWARFAADIRAGTRTVPDFDHAVRLAQLLDRVDASSDEGRRLTVDY